MDFKQSIDLILNLMLSWYSNIKSNNSGINISNIEQWVINKIHPYNSIEKVYILPEPYATECEDTLLSVELVNKYFNSTKFDDNYKSTFNDMYVPVIQIEINPMIWLSITQYEIIQIIEANIF